MIRDRYRDELRLFAETVVPVLEQELSDQYTVVDRYETGAESVDLGTVTVL